MRGAIKVGSAPACAGGPQHARTPAGDPGAESPVVCKGDSAVCKGTPQRAVGTPRRPGKGAPGAPTTGQGRESPPGKPAKGQSPGAQQGSTDGDAGEASTSPSTWKKAKSPPGPTSSLPSAAPHGAAEGREGAGPMRSALPATARGAEQDQTRRSGFEWLEIPVLGGSSPAEIPSPGCICQAPPPPPLTRCKAAAPPP